MKQQICRIGKKIYDKGFSPGASGNISCRIGDKILLTASGACLGELTERDLIITDIEGNIIEGEKKPTSEKFMHYEIYKRRPDVSCILHAHPPKTTALAVIGKDLNTPLIAEAVVTLGEIAFAKYDTPSTNELARAVGECFEKHDVVIMSNHGAVVCSNNLDDACHKIETLEFISEINIITEIMGRKNEIPPEKLEELKKLREFKYGTVLKL